jgi:hypothetical protein
VCSDSFPSRVVEKTDAVAHSVDQIGSDSDQLERWAVVLPTRKGASFSVRLSGERLHPTGGRQRPIQRPRKCRVRGGTTVESRRLRPPAQATPKDQNRKGALSFTPLHYGGQADACPDFHTPDEQMLVSLTTSHATRIRFALPMISLRQHPRRRRTHASTTAQIVPTRITIVSAIAAVARTRQQSPVLVRPASEPIPTASRSKARGLVAYLAVSAPTPCSPVNARTPNSLRSTHTPSVCDQGHIPQ